jgi:hypothetical protein
LNYILENKGGEKKMAVHNAIVVPRQPWGTDGLADVWVMDDLNIVKILKLENRGTSVTENEIKKDDYAPGLIRINTDHLPTGDSLFTQIELTTEDSVKHTDWPQGGVLFI